MHGIEDGVLERNDSAEGLVDRIGLLEHLGLKIVSGSWTKGETRNSYRCGSKNE
jgi:hypothetical protein